MANIGKIIALNKRAFSDYEIEEHFEAGIKLTGPEVKSSKQGKMNLKASWAIVGKDMVPKILNMHISSYKPASSVQHNYDPERSRILLLNKKQIKYLFGKLKEKRYTLLPLKAYANAGIIKIEMGLGRGKKQYEKRESIKKRDIERDIGRKLKS